MSVTINTGANYAPFNEQTVIDFIRPLQLFDRHDHLEVSEIGDGNLNLVFRIVDPESKKSIIVKQALPYAKVVGESWPLSLERATIESKYLQLVYEQVPDLVPKVYHRDPELAATVMEDLSDHIILRKGLIEANQYPLLGKHIGRYIAHTLFFTSDFYLHPFTKKERVKEFINPDLCKITEDLVFTDPFFDHDTNDFPEELKPAVEKLWQDDSLRLETAQLKFQFLTQAEALVHGDLHTGSIFVKEDSTKVIDPEFAYYGPFGFDLGQFFANLLLNAIAQTVRMEDEEKLQEYLDYLFQTKKETWDTFVSELKQLWSQHGKEIYTKVPGTFERFLGKVWKDAIGFEGCEVIRRTIGLAHVADLDGIEDFNKQIQAKEKALKLGADLIKKRREFPDFQTLETWLKENLA
jgi:5-methylthioribose kinase